jgi:hypothetical protein
VPLDYRVVAWNAFDEDGNPILEINEQMTRADFESQVQGKYAFLNVSRLRSIPRWVIDKALSDAP